MPDLAGSLRGQDLEQLSYIAELWGLELSASDARRARSQLVQGILEPHLLSEVVEALAHDARLALGDLQSAAGRLPWSQFTRTHGEVREMGPARMARSKPHRNPASPAEKLWYRALLARAFFDTASGPQEFAYIPEDLLALLPPTPAPEPPQLGRPARSQERAKVSRASDAILDHACTLLAGLRSDFSLAEITRLAPEIVPHPLVLSPLLEAAGLIDETGQPHSSNTRAFLEAPRSQALAHLARAWLASETFNDMRMLPHLDAEGSWQNQPLPARQTILSLLQQLPTGTWWHLSSFIETVHQQRPDFQRPAGDYDSWYLKDARTGAFLRGFEHWRHVEGELLRWIITGPLHWFCAVDLGAPSPGDPAASFRLAANFDLLLADKHLPESLPEDSGLHIDSKGLLDLPAGFPRAARYQLARFCDWEPRRKGSYRYHLTPASLARARDQELNVKQLLALLSKYIGGDIPPNILNALRRWDSHGAQARLEHVVVLRLGDPAILKALLSSRAARFLGDPIGPTAVLVKPGARRQIIDVLAELGYLTHANFTVEGSLDD